MVAALLSPTTLAEKSKKKKDEGPFWPPKLERPREMPKPPWPRRRRHGVKMKGKGQGLIDLKKWPAEPPSPDNIDPERLAPALRRLCANWMPPKRPLRYARWILQYSKEFDVDPFLLAALVYRQTRCIPGEKDDYGVGLLMINEGMHGGFIRKRRYRYHTFEGGAWRRQELKLDRYAFARGNLRRAQPAIYFGAALLSMWNKQCRHIDRAFGSVPHRHFVSHFVWGDRVKGAGAEDRVLRSRRRLIAYYQGENAPKDRGLGEFQGLKLRCPLEAPPRKVTSEMGADRSDGNRFHRGIDFSSTWYEPVLAVADGRVVLAGLDRKTGGPKNVDPEEAQKIKRSEMGPGGLFVMIRHENGLLSAYMHLVLYTVKVGQRVKAGEMIGRVGKTGIRESGAHLHFELRFDGKHIDPMPHLAPYVFRQRATYIGRRVLAEQRRVRRKRRIKKWRARKAAQQQRQHGNTPAP
jgi:hypothetical protein